MRREQLHRGLISGDSSSDLVDEQLKGSTGNGTVKDVSVIRAWIRLSRVDVGKLI